jgi:hypothetical protein
VVELRLDRGHPFELRVKGSSNLLDGGFHAGEPVSGRHRR